MPFQNNIFINCPFDNEYKPLLNVIIFTSIYFDLEPLISQNKSSSVIRNNQIKDLIKNCKYGLHDLSRSKPMKDGELPRFNMPYELGLDIGAYTYGNRQLKSKRILILETEQYHYQKVLSDIAGQDIESHNNDPEILLKRIRDWISNNKEEMIEPSSKIWHLYNQFTNNLNSFFNSNYPTNDMQYIAIGDYIKFVKEWKYTLIKSYDRTTITFTPI